ncbi:MAG: histidine--tRNA ligase [Pyrinomonadaceae bacterium]
MVSTNPARGMRDFLPVDVRKREYVIGIIKEVYESYGFEPLETPAVENLETLTGKYGEEGNQLIFKILKRGEKLRQETGDGSRETSDSSLQSLDSRLSDLALRYDLTVPLARVVANNKNELPKFFKRYQIQPVWRADRPARGRFREFYQCDVDAIGSSSMVVEDELISAVSSIFETLGFKSFVINLNHRGILTAILDTCGIPKIQHVDALVALDKADKIGFSAVGKELIDRKIGSSAISRFLDFMESFTELLLTRLYSDEVKKAGKSVFFDVNQRTMAHISGFVSNHSQGRQGVKELESLVRFSQDTLDPNPLLVMPYLARGLSYYTGTIMEINVPDLVGSLGGGGRYDGLIGMFGKEQIPACGFSLGLERILVVMEERGMFPPEIAESTPADVMVTVWNEETIAESLKLASEIRAAGLRVTLYPEADKLGKQIKYADSIKVPWVCVLAETEIAENKVTLKNMRTGEQATIGRAEIISNIHG